MATVVVVLADASCSGHRSLCLHRGAARLAGAHRLDRLSSVWARGWSLVPAAGHGRSTSGSSEPDALSAVFLLATGFLYATVAVYSIGYFATRHAEGAALERSFRPYSRRFYVGLNAFAGSMLCAPAVNGLALLWIAIEITTVVSALLVAIDDTEGATEAAWKYVLIASSGLGIALLATIVMYYAGAQRLGSSYDLSFEPLLSAAGALPATPVRLAFVLAVVGFGTKVGLFPVHTWLPDAHAEAPTPVSALLSGSLLAVSFYAILRYYQVAVVTVGTRFPQTVLLVFGVLSLLLAALYVLEQYDVKRLLAYSSVEHMGILAIGVSFGCADRVRRGAAARARPRRRQGQRVHGRRRAGAEVRNEGAGPDAVGDERAAVVGAPVPACDLRPVRDAAVRHLPQRVPDRGRWFRQRAPHRGGRSDRTGHPRVPRHDHRDYPRALPPAGRNGTSTAPAPRAECPLSDPVLPEHGRLGLRRR